MKYKIRRFWRHFKYWLLELFFDKPQLKRLIDIDRLDFEDAVKLTRLNEEKWISKDEMEWFRADQTRKYGLQYSLARQMADTLAKHIELTEVYDVDKDQYVCIGSVVVAERRY